MSDTPAPTAVPAELEDALATARRRCEALGEVLRARAGGAVTADERAELRGKIAALIRVADAQAQGWRAVAESARALPELWKQLTETPAPDAPPARPPASGASRDATRPASARSDYLGASTYSAKGWSAYAASDYEGAEAAFARALELAPEDAEAAALLGWARAALGRDDEALLAAQHVLVTRPRGAAASLARVAVGRVCLAKGIAGEAVEHFARVARDGDDRRATLYATLGLGVAYRTRGLYDDAVAFLRRALALGPNLVEARYELGEAHWAAGAPDAAREAWQAGAAAGAFSPWGRRCAARLAEVDGGLAITSSAVDEPRPA